MSLYINDKTTGKINSISGQQRVDKELNINSENPVENKVISSKLEELDTKLIDIKKSVSDGKSKVASAITEKGVSTEATDTFDIMAENIGQIENGTKNTITIYSKGIISNANSSNTVITEKILKTPYLVGNGIGYFNTHHEFTANTRIEFKFMCMHTNDDNRDLTGFGNNKDFWLLVEFDNNRMDYYSGRNGESVQNYWYVSTNKMYDGAFDAKNGSFTFNSDTSVLYPTRGIGMEIPIFAVHRTSGEFTNQMTDMLRLYAFKIYEDDVLVKDYVPAQDSNGITCLYDKVNDEYLYDATGTNTFEYGEEYRI